MSVVAAVRPDSWNLPLFLHVVGAMILVGGLLTGASVLGFARGEARMLRLGYWALLTVSLPGWVLMRVGAEWIYAREGWDDLPEGVDDPRLTCRRSDHRRRRRADLPPRAHPRRRRRLPAAAGQGRPPAEGDAGALTGPPGRVSGRCLGDGGQAGLAQASGRARAPAWPEWRIRGECAGSSESS